MDEELTIALPLNRAQAYALYFILQNSGHYLQEELVELDKLTKLPAHQRPHEFTKKQDLFDAIDGITALLQCSKDLVPELTSVITEFDEPEGPKKIIMPYGRTHIHKAEGGPEELPNTNKGPQDPNT